MVNRLYKWLFFYLFKEKNKFSEIKKNKKNKVIIC